MHNVELIRYAGGWLERTDPASIATHGRIEAFHDLGSIESEAEAYRIADAIFEDFANPREQTDIAIEPRTDAETPYLGWNVGDVVTVDGVQHRVMAISASVDENGRLIFVPTLNANIVLDPLERVFQMLGQVWRGALGGNSKHAQLHVAPYVPRADPSAGRALYYESFNKADGALGPNLPWTAFSYGVDLAVSGNRAHKQFTNTETDGAGARADVALASDSYAQIVVGPIAGDFYAKKPVVYLRTRGTTNAPPALSDEFFEGYFMAFQLWSTQTEVSCWKAEAGDFLTQLGSATTGPIAVEGTVLRVEVEGDQIRALMDGVVIKTTTDSSITSGSRAGFTVQITTVPTGGFPVDVHLDDFECGDL